MTKKFPRIPHLPWSPGGTNDDKRLPEYIIPMLFGSRKYHSGYREIRWLESLFN
jgi:hypothetical protein